MNTRETTTPYSSEAHIDSLDTQMQSMSLSNNKRLRTRKHYEMSSSESSEDEDFVMISTSSRPPARKLDMREKRLKTKSSSPKERIKRSSIQSVDKEVITQ